MRVITLFLLGLLYANAAEPRGHMQPLGGHRDPDGTIKAVDGFPGPLEFYTNYVVPGVPVLFRGAAKGAGSIFSRTMTTATAAEMDVFDRWTDEYGFSANGSTAWCS